MTFVFFFGKHFIGEEKTTGGSGKNSNGGATTKTTGRLK